MAASLARAILRKHSKSCFSSLTTKSLPLGFSSPRTHHSNSGSDPESKKATTVEECIPGMDHRHWLAFVDEKKLKNKGADEIIDYYVKTLARVLTSEEEAKSKIYSVKYDGYYAFGSEIDEDTAYELGGLKEVLSVVPDSYVDEKNKDYGGELYENGKIVLRSPERQKRVTECPEELRWPQAQ